jgi:hypothetical protein
MHTLLAFVCIVISTASEVAIAPRNEHDCVAPLAPTRRSKAVTLKSQLLVWCLMFHQQCILENNYANAYIENKERSDSFVWSFNKQCTLSDDDVNSYMSKHVRWNSVWSLNKQCARTNDKINAYIEKHVRWSSMWSCEPISRYSHGQRRRRRSKYNVFKEDTKIKHALAAKFIVAAGMRPEVEITEHDDGLCVSEHDWVLFFDQLNEKIKAANAKAVQNHKLAKEAIWHAISAKLQLPTLA